MTARSSRSAQALLVAIVALLAVVLLYPIWLTLEGAFRTRDGEGWTLRHILTVFTDPLLREGLLNALMIATLTTALSLLLALPLAFVGARTSFRGQALLSSLVLLPLILPPFVGAIGMRQMLGRRGALNGLLESMGVIDAPIDFLGGGGLFGVVVVEALHLYPILYLNLVAALANLDPALEEAAENLGAGRWRRFRRIVLPLIRPGLFAGGTIVFIWSFTELGTPLMFEFHRVTPVQIFNGIKEIADSREPYALTAVMLLSAAALYALGRLAFGGRAYAMYAKASIQARPRRLAGLRAAGAMALFGGVTLLAALPHIFVVLVALAVPGTWYATVLPQAWTIEFLEAAVSHPVAADAIRNSLLYSSLAVAITVVIGLAVARLLVRTRVRGRGLLDALVMLPLAVPGLVIAFGYVAVTFRWPFGGTIPPWLAWLRHLLPDRVFAAISDAPLAGWADVVGADPNPVGLLVVAYAVRRLPYVVRAAVAGLEQTSSELEEAAFMLGASRFTVLRRIVVPLIAANLIAGALLAFSFAMLEVSDSLILAQRQVHYPITKAIFVLNERLGDGQALASAMGVWGMALLATTLIAASVFMGRRLGAVFRL
ncbi:MAG TPA: iron ABC transporter permease [Phycisphaerales bacterium]|nr:iron ABC transporter permease [Phycisphaerales bacterium]HMP36731.1 iron ABC transporter permease [Phycisphaerales bacterium]